MSASQPTPPLAHEIPKIPDLELIECIGSGGYGEVWLARSALGTFRAVKIVRRAEFDDDRPYEREFAGIRKFEPISRSHEGFVDLLQVGRDDAEGWFYYVMELADHGSESRLQPANACVLSRDQEQPGRTETRTPCRLKAGLQTYVPRTLAAEVKLRGALPLDECLRIALSLTRALAELHRHGLVHRDIKPSNIIFVGGVPKLADIGLVASANEARSFVGTEGYIPPEGPGTVQADLYSLGIVLYVISTGKSHRDFPEPPTDLATRPDRERWLELQAIIHRACQSDPRQRYPDAGGMLDDLNRLGEGKSIRRAHQIERRWHLVRRAALIVTAVSLLVASIVASIQHLGLSATRNSLTSSSQVAGPLQNRVSQIPEANNEFWKGWQCYRRFTAEGIKQGWEHFKRAIELDPKCTAAYNGLFEVLISVNSTSVSWPFTAQEADAQLRTAARKLMELDNTMAEAHAAQAIIDFHDWKWEQAERGFKRAIRLNTNCAIAYTRYGFCLAYLDRPDEALILLQRADDLDPILPRVKKTMGQVFFAKRQFREAIAQYQKALELQPDYPNAHECMGLCYIALEDYDQAIDEFVQQQVGLGQDRTKVEREADELRKALAESGPHGYWEKELRRCQVRGAAASQCYLAECYARSGQMGEAFAHLERAYENHERGFISQPFFNNCWDSYRSDERFRRLLRKVGLAK